MSTFTVQPDAAVSAGRPRRRMPRGGRRLLASVGGGAAVTALTVALIPAGPAGATPGSGASSTIVAEGTTGDRVTVDASGQTEVVYQRVTIQPGGYTGWHSHPGPLLVVVESGTLTHYDEHCGVETYTAGQAFVEVPGHEHVHMGENLGPVAVVLDVTYVVPAGSSLRVDAPAPSCVTGQ